MKKNYMPDWALFIALIITILHIILTARGVRIQLPFYVLVPLAYVITAVRRYSDPLACKADSQMALSFAPVLFMSAFNAIFGGEIPVFVYSSLRILSFVLECLLRIFGLATYRKRNPNPVNTMAIVTIIGYAVTEILFVLVLAFDGPYNAAPIRASARLGGAALLLQIMHLIMLAVCALIPFPRTASLPKEATHTDA